MTNYLDQYIVVTRLICRPQGASIDEIREAVGKTERAVFQMLAQLDLMDFPLYTEQDPENPRKVRYKALHTFAEYLPDMNFTDEEKAVFNYLVSNAKKTPSMEQATNHLLTKIKLLAAEHGALLDAGSNKAIPIIGANPLGKKLDNRKSRDVMADILQVISEKKWMDISYSKAGKATSFRYRNLYPVVIFTWQGDPYVYVLNKFGTLRMLALERIAEVLCSFEGEQPKTKVDIQAMMSDPFGIMYDTEPFAVKLLISGGEAAYERAKNWPECVHFTECDDGCLMEAVTHSLFECKRWILARTGCVTVLEPQWLKDEIKTILQNGLDQYSK